MMTHVEVRPAQEHDAAPVVAFFRRQEATVGLWPKAVLCDGAFGTGDVRAELGELGMEVVAKLRPLTDWNHLGKDEVVIELSANEGRGSVTCPAGVTTPDRRMARDGQSRLGPLFRFPRTVCAACTLRERCLGGPAGRVAQPVRSPPGRQVQLHFHFHFYEAALQQARATPLSAHPSNGGPCATGCVRGPRSSARSRRCSVAMACARGALSAWRKRASKRS